MDDFQGRRIGFYSQPWNEAFTSEYQLFLDALKVCGIPFSHHHMPNYQREEEFQKILLDSGFELTSHALTGLVLGDLMYVFSTGQAHWTTDKDDPEARHQGWGPNGAFVFTYNMKTKEVVKRGNYSESSSGFLPGLHGRNALEGEYGPFPDFTP